jgi:hypothetical protein
MSSEVSHMVWSQLRFGLVASRLLSFVRCF